MGRKKKGKFPRIGLPIPHFGIEIPEHAKRLIWAVFMFALALIFLFAFFEKSGVAGNMLVRGAEFVIGNAVWLMPFFLAIMGIVLWGMKEYNILSPLFALLLLLVGVSGSIGGVAQRNGEDVLQMAGWLGFIVSQPLFSLFEFWVTEIIFVSIVAVASIIFWQLLPHEKGGEKSSIIQGAQERVKRIFEPKFNVDEVEHDDDDDDGEEEDDEEDEEEGEEEEKSQKLAKSFGFSRGKKEKRKITVTATSNKDYKLPPADLLETEKGSPNAGDIKNYSALIKKTLQNFDIPVEVSEVNIGPAVTQYAFKPSEGIKLSRIVGLQNDLSLALAAHPLRIEAPIPGRALVGIEIPNKTRATVRLRGLVENAAFKDFPSSLAIAIGRDVSGSPVIADLARMPHILVAGATGAGKTIALSNIILSLIFRNSPHTLRLLLVDPKRVEFPVYGDLPHLLAPVIFDTQRTVNALKWLIKEMERRFEVLADARVRDIRSYHALLADQIQRKGETDLEEMPYIVVVIDELADLMAARGKELEGMIVRLAQMSRAIGIHLVLATQRPSVEILTGLIKANITSRIAFQVASQIDSRTILDMAGAEKLLGQGDMLYISNDFSKPRRIQGAYVSDKDVKRVVGWISKEGGEFEREDIDTDDLSQRVIHGLESSEDDDGDEDPMYEEAKRVVIEAKRASASLLQRRLKLGYARAARLIDTLEDKGIVGPADGAKPREVYTADHNMLSGEEGEKEDKGDDEWEKP